MLNEHHIEHTYREYTKDPLSESEIRDVLSKLGVGPRDVLRSRDAKKHGLLGTESDDELVTLMVKHPGLLQRPIGVMGKRAAVGRPIENLLALDRGE